MTSPRNNEDRHQYLKLQFIIKFNEIIYLKQCVCVYVCDCYIINDN